MHCSTSRMQRRTNQTQGLKRIVRAALLVAAQSGSEEPRGVCTHLHVLEYSPVKQQ